MAQPPIVDETLISKSFMEESTAHSSPSEDDPPTFESHLDSLAEPVAGAPASVTIGCAPGSWRYSVTFQLAGDFVLHAQVSIDPPYNYARVHSMGTVAYQHNFNMDEVASFTINVQHGTLSCTLTNRRQKQVAMYSGRWPESICDHIIVSGRVRHASERSAEALSP